MNIIYIHTHDLGDWISPCGRDVETPHLEALAGESTLFTNAHCAAPTCSPSRAAMLTGTYPHQASMLGLAHRGFSLTNPDRHLASQLRKNGYETVLCGIQHEFSGPNVEGFPYDEVLSQVFRGIEESKDSFQLRRDRQVAKVASDWIAARSSNQKFFLSVGFFQPHRPLIAPDTDLSVEAQEIPSDIPDTPQVRSDFQSLKSSIRLLDECVGEVVRALKEKGEWDRSIILFTTDHGIAFPLHKCFLKDAGTRVSMLLRHPSMPETHGAEVGALVSHLDVVPTLYEWAGLETPDWCEGHSLTEVISGRKRSVRDELYSEVNYHAAYEPMRTVRTEKYRLIKRFLDSDNWLLSNMDDSPSKDAWLKSPVFESGINQIELYDLECDPAERVNLAGSDAYRDIQAHMTNLLLEWMEKTDDPLLEGHLERPANGIINHPDSKSPHEQFYEEVYS